MSEEVEITWYVWPEAGRTRLTTTDELAHLDATTLTDDDARKLAKHARRLVMSDEAELTWARTMLRIAVRLQALADHYDKTKEA